MNVVDDGRWTACFVTGAGYPARIRHLPHQDDLWAFVALPTSHPCYGMRLHELPRALRLPPIEQKAPWGALAWSGSIAPGGGRDPLMGESYWFVGFTCPTFGAMQGAEQHCRDALEALAAALLGIQEAAGVGR